MSGMRSFKNRRISRDEVKTPDIGVFQRQIGRDKSCMLEKWAEYF